MKKWIKFGVMLISLIGIIAIVVINIQKTCTHIDRNRDMRCDRCKGILPYNEYVFYDELKMQVEENQITVKGNMPQDSEIQVLAFDNEAVDFAKIKQKYNNIKKIVKCYDISIKAQEKEYEPNDYFQKCMINIDHLNLEKEKQYAILHDMGNGNFEMLNGDIEDSQISFKTSHFSVFMLVEVGGYNISFEGENYKVLDKNFNEIISTYTTPSNVDFEFYVMPDNGYGIASVTTSTTLNSGDNEYLYSVGYVEGNKCLITKVNKDISVNVDAVLMPKITKEPETQKIKMGTRRTWEIEAENATTYLWQYRRDKNDYWKNANALGIGYNTAVFKSNGAMDDVGSLDFRCLVGNETFDLDERVQSFNFKIIAASDEIVYADYPIILSENINENAKKEVGKEKAIYEVTAMGKDLTFTWQYRYRKNDYWKTIGSNVGSVKNEVIDSSVNHPVTKSTLTTIAVSSEISNYEFRCLVGNPYHINYDTVCSSTMYPIPAQNEILQNIQYHKIEVGKQPKTVKVKIGNKAVFDVEADGVNKYKWQYKTSPLEDFWTDVDSSIGTGYDTKTLTIDTSKMSINEDLKLEGNVSGYLFRCVVSNTSLESVTQNSDIAFLIVAQDDYESLPIILDNVNNGFITAKLQNNGSTNDKGLLILNKTSDKNRTINLKYSGKLLIPHVEISIQKRTGTNEQGIPIYTDINKISDYFNITLSSNNEDLNLKNSKQDASIEVYDVTNLDMEHNLNFNLKDSVESGIYKITFELMNYSNKKIATEAILIEVK